MAPPVLLLLNVSYLAQILEGGASYQEILGCDKIPPNNACLGGVPRSVWDWAQAFSVASNKCFKYIAGDRWNEPSCIEYLLNSGPSHPHCDNKYTPAPYALPPCTSFSCRYRVKKGSTTHFTSVDAIQAAVYTDGSVSASFTVYVFVHYTASEYQRPCMFLYITLHLNISASAC